MNKLTLTAKGDFPFTFYIEKAVPVEEGDQLIVEGVASTMNVDHDNERMAAEALRAMSDMVNTRGVPLRLEHNQDAAAIIGNVYKAWVDERNQLWIRAAIDPNHPSGPMIHSSLKQGAKFGLSVGGRVKSAVRELVESTGKMVKTFYDVVLDEVSVTRKPANYDAWLFAKSIKSKEADIGPYYDSPLYQRFLFENPQLDYLQAFAKSVPDGAWKREVSNNDSITIKNMDEKDKKDKAAKAEDSKEEAKKAMPDADEGDTEKSSHEEDDKAEKSGFVSKSEFAKFGEMVAKGFAGITSLIKSMDASPKDAVNPDKAKPEDETQQTAKSEADGTQDASTIAANEPHDQNAPDKDKPKAVGDEAQKSQDEEDTEKSEDEDDDKAEKSEEEADAEKNEDPAPDEYAVKSVEQAISHIDALAKKMAGNKVVKSAEKVEKSASEASSIDRFAASVSMFADSIAERFEKSGHRVPGLGQLIADEIRSNPELQAEIAGMAKEASFKKSRAVVGGIAYMTTKDGKKYALTAKAVGEDDVRKSEKATNFKDLYKSKFSSLGEAQE